jgi:hypothetical protein
LFEELSSSLPRKAQGVTGGFRSVGFVYVSAELVEKFMIIVSLVYAKARELYAERLGEHI